MADFKNRSQLEAWLGKQPREVAVALAARAALRVLPVVQTAKHEAGGLVLPVFRATAISWAAAKYPAHETEFVAVAAVAAAAAAAVAAAAAADAAATTATAAADAAAAAAYAAYADDAASTYAADAASAAAADAYADDAANAAAAAAAAAADAATAAAADAYAYADDAANADADDAANDAANADAADAAYANADAAADAAEAYAYAAEAYAYAADATYVADAAAAAAAAAATAADAYAAVAAARAAAAAARAASAAAADASAADASAADAFFWSALSTDATRMEKGAAASVIARLPLWPQGQPDQLRHLWQELEAGPLAAKQDWQVWTTWYGDRLNGRVREEERELAYVRIKEALWDQGPAIVNAEIARRLNGVEPPRRGKKKRSLRPAAKPRNTNQLDPTTLVL